MHLIPVNLLVKTCYRLQIGQFLASKCLFLRTRKSQIQKNTQPLLKEELTLFSSLTFRNHVPF